MSVQHNCPRCRLNVAEERLKIVPFICDNCGHTLGRTDRATEGKQETSDTRMLLGIAGALVLSFLFIASSVELRYLQTRDFIGLSSLSSLERLAQVCMELSKPDCVEHALTRQAKFDSRRTTRLADYLITRQKYKEAVGSLRKYIAGGKADAQAHATFARALAESNQMEEASKHFERALSARPLMIEHAHSYVKYLTRSKRFDQALSVILRVRRTNVNALPVEYRVISEMRGAANNRVMASKR